MKKSVICLSLLTLSLALSACSTATKEKLGLAKKAPNEFMVMPKAPLSLPPEYDLRPVTDMGQSEAKADTTGMSEAEKSLIEEVEK